MAWKCVRCQGKIYAPQERSIRFVVEWSFVRKYSELLCEVRNIKDVKDGAVVTHVSCDRPEREDWLALLRQALRVPPDIDHPLLS